MKTETIVSDMFRLALLDLLKIAPKQVHFGERYEATFASELIDKPLQDFDSGVLTVNARDFVDSIIRTKNRIFEARRVAEATTRRRSPAKW